MKEYMDALYDVVERLHQRYELSKTITPDYFEPGMMEYLEQSDGCYDSETGDILLRFEVKGTRYEGRTETIEKMKVGDRITVLRDPANAYNANNFTLINAKGQSVGNMPADICNALAPLYDAGALILMDAHVSFVDPITKRNRHAKQAVLFVKLHCMLLCME
jgi:hypothetical protein